MRGDVFIGRRNAGCDRKVEVFSEREGCLRYVHAVPRKFFVPQFGAGKPQRDDGGERAASDIEAGVPVRKRERVFFKVCKEARKADYVPPRKIANVCGKRFGRIHIASSPFAPFIGERVRKRVYVFRKRGELPAVCGKYALQYLVEFVDDISCVGRDRIGGKHAAPFQNCRAGRAVRRLVFRRCAPYRFRNTGVLPRGSRLRFRLGRRIIYPRSFPFYRGGAVDHRARFGIFCRTIFFNKFFVALCAVSSVHVFGISSS